MLVVPRLPLSDDEKTDAVRWMPKDNHLELLNQLSAELGRHQPRTHQD